MRSEMDASWLTSYSILDASDPVGVSGFYWLPPVAREDDALGDEPGEAGESDPPGEPGSWELNRSVLDVTTVEVCEWDGKACIGDPVASFDSQGTGSARLRITEGDDHELPHYVTVWHLGRNGGTNPGAHRIRILVDGREVGHADAVVVGSGASEPPEDRGDFVTLNPERSLPVKFLLTEALESTEEPPTEEPPADEPTTTPGLALVANGISHDVSVIDVASNTVTASVGVGLQPVAAALSPDGTRAWVANYESNDVSVVDPAAGTVTATVAVGTNPQSVAVSPDGLTVVVANAGSDDVTLIDAASGSATAAVPVCELPLSVAVTPSGGTAYVACPMANAVSVVDLGSGTVTASVPVGGSPRSVAFSPDGSRALTANFGSSDVSVIDVASAAVTATIDLESQPMSVAFAPDGAGAYVASPYSGTVTAIDLESAAATSTITTGGFPQAVAISPDGSGYVAKFAEDSVAVFDPSTGTLVTNVGVGAGPTGLAVGP
ncbi:MAG: cytochrome D1 domain-containing protein [Gemmatimonadota bacterium]